MDWQLFGPAASATAKTDPRKCDCRQRGRLIAYETDPGVGGPTRQSRVIVDDAGVIYGTWLMDLSDFGCVDSSIVDLVVSGRSTLNRAL